MLNSQRRKSVPALTLSVCSHFLCIHFRDLIIFSECGSALVHLHWGLKIISLGVLVVNGSLSAIVNICSQN